MLSKRRITSKLKVSRTLTHAPMAVLAMCHKSSGPRSHNIIFSIQSIVSCITIILYHVASNEYFYSVSNTAL